MTNQKYTSKDIDRAIALNLYWQDYTPAELYLLHKAQQHDNRLAHWTVAICVTVGAAMVAALMMGWA